MIFRTAAAKAKNGTTCSHCRRQVWPIAAYFRPHGLFWKASRALWPASASCGAVDFAQLGDDGLPVFPGRKIQRIADQMNDAGLNRGLRKDGLDRLRKALQAVDHGDQDVLDATSLQLVHDLEP